MDCPRCGESVMIYEYADILPDAFNVYDKCMKCKATFNGKMIDRFNVKSPFDEKEVEENDMPEVRNGQ